jgi:hypothetical protein
MSEILSTTGTRYEELFWSIRTSDGPFRNDQMFFGKMSNCEKQPQPCFSGQKLHARDEKLNNDIPKVEINTIIKTSTHRHSNFANVQVT